MTNTRQRLRRVKGTLAARGGPIGRHLSSMLDKQTPVSALTDTTGVVLSTRGLLPDLLSWLLVHTAGRIWCIYAHNGIVETGPGSPGSSSSSWCVYFGQCGGGSGHCSTPGAAYEGVLAHGVGFMGRGLGSG